MGFWERFKRAAEAFRQEEESVAIFEQEEEKTVTMAEEQPEEVIKNQVGRPFNPQSNREAVFCVMEKKLLQTPCSFQTIYQACCAEGLSLSRAQVNKAVEGLCGGKWVSSKKSCSGVSYLLTKAQAKRRRESKRKKERGGSFPLFLSLSNELQKIMAPYLCERWPDTGKEGLRADLSDLLSKQLACQTPLSDSELKNARCLMKMSKTIKCYAPIFTSLYKKLKKVADEAECSPPLAALCLVLREEEQKKLSLAVKAGQHRQTVAYALRMAVCKDLGKFCQKVGLNPNRYRYWEQGQETYWTLSFPEQENVAKYLNTSVEKIATPDGRPVFLYE